VAPTCTFIPAARLRRPETAVARFHSFRPDPEAFGAINRTHTIQWGHMQITGYTAAIAALLCLSGATAMALEPMTATIRVSSGSLYDYVIIGEHPKATDDYDNAYDTVSPGNPNVSTGQPFISAIVTHPDWKPAMRELRGDIRSLAKRQGWQLIISSSLPAGTPMNVAFRKKESTLPQGMKLTLKEYATGKEHDLGRWSYMIAAPGPGTSTRLFILAEQP